MSGEHWVHDKPHGGIKSWNDKLDAADRELKEALETYRDPTHNTFYVEESISAASDQIVALRGELDAHFTSPERMEWLRYQLADFKPYQMCLLCRHPIHPGGCDGEHCHEQRPPDHTHFFRGGDQLASIALAMKPPSDTPEGTDPKYYEYSVKRKTPEWVQGKADTWDAAFEDVVALLREHHKLRPSGVPGHSGGLSSTTYQLGDI